MENSIKSVLIDEETLNKRIEELAFEIEDDYKDKKPVMVCVLKGAIVFFAELCKKLHFPLEMDFLSISSYADKAKTSGMVRLLKDLEIDIQGRDVIIVEDIIDSGLTLNYLMRILAARRPNSIKVVSLLDKPSERRCIISSDYHGFTVPDDYVVGFGLDFAGLYRNLPYIGVLKPEIYE
ncbi:MAG: hypoxanthine phosphoribosyltransferase [Clostridia bacterium]